MILNKSPGLLWGAGGAMMAWELAQRKVYGHVRFVGSDRNVTPVPREHIEDWMGYPASREFYRIIDRAEAAFASRETLTWANGHNTVRL